MSRWWRCVLVLLLLAPARRGDADCEDENLQAQVAQQSFVLVSSEASAVMGSNAEPAYGSGVLITLSGYVLTAGHVVQDLMDAGSYGLDAQTVPGSRVAVEFLNDNEMPDGIRRMAEVVGYFNVDRAPDPPGTPRNADVALLRLRALPEDIKSRALPSVDENLGHEDCDDSECLRFLGVPDLGKPLEDPAGRPVQNSLPDHTRMVQTSTWFGYSGGPVYRVETLADGTCEWRLVGLTRGGRPDRPVNKFMTLIDGAAPLYNVVRDEIRLVTRVPFPSQRFLDALGSNPMTLKEEATGAWVNDRIKDRQSGWGLTNQMIREDLLTGSEGSDPGPRVRALLDHMIAAARREVPALDLPPLFSVLNQRSLSLVGGLEKEHGYRMNGWREEARVQWASCDKTEGNSARLRCWLRVIGREEFLWEHALKRRFEAALDAADEDGGRKRARYWGDVWAEQLIEWGDALTKIALDTSPALSNAKAWFPNLLMIDAERSLESDEARRNLRVDVNAAALDKLLKGVEGLRAYHAPKAPLADVLPDAGSHMTRFCREIRGTIERLQGLTAGGDFPKYRAYLVNLRADGVPGCPRKQT